MCKNKTRRFWGLAMGIVAILDGLNLFSFIQRHEPRDVLFMAGTSIITPAILAIYWWGMSE